MDCKIDRNETYSGETGALGAGGSATASIANDVLVARQAGMDIDYTVTAMKALSTPELRLLCLAAGVAGVVKVVVIQVGGTIKPRGLATRVHQHGT